MTRRALAFLDVLGFRQLVTRVPHDDLLVLYKELLDAGYAHTTRTRFPDDHRKWDEEPVYYDDEIKQVRFIDVMMASDSIVVLSENDDWREVADVVSAVSRLLIAGFQLGMPLRGAITIGDLDLVDGTDLAERGPRVAKALGLVGAGLVRAYELESRFEWSGAVFDAALVDSMEQSVIATAGDGGTMSA